MRNVLPALLAIAVSLPACSFSYSSSRSSGKPGASSGVQGTGKPARRADSDPAPAPAPQPAPQAETPAPAPAPAPAPKAEPAPAPAPATPSREGRSDTQPREGAATSGAAQSGGAAKLSGGAGDPGAGNPAGGTGTISSGAKKPIDPPKNTDRAR